MQDDLNRVTNESSQLARQLNGAGDYIATVYAKLAEAQKRIAEFEAAAKAAPKK